MGVYASSLSLPALSFPTRTPGGAQYSFDAVAPLLPTDGARASEERNHPHRREALGQGLASRLAAMPEPLIHQIEAACDEGMGMP